MMSLLIFFVTVVALEIACLVGLWWVYRHMHRWHLIVLGARTTVLNVRAVLIREIKSGKATANTVAHWYQTILAAVPWWFKFLYTLLRWTGKIKLQIS